jgi:hypothetical protein
MGTKVLFARIGWMKFYAGAIDEKPVGGGSYTKEHIGSELFNFKPVGPFLYGFAKGGSRTSAFNLKRIDPGADNSSFSSPKIPEVANELLAGTKMPLSTANGNPIPYSLATRGGLHFA